MNKPNYYKMYFKSENPFEFNYLLTSSVFLCVVFLCLSVGVWTFPLYRLLSIITRQVCLKLTSTEWDELLGLVSLVLTY